MKKSLAIGLLATVGFSEEEWRPTYYKTTPAPSSTSTPVYKKPVFPTADINSLFPLSGTSYQSYDQSSGQAIQNARNNIAITDRSIDSLFLRLPSNA